MLRLVLVALLALGSRATVDDASTGLAESAWFHANANMADLTRYRQLWKGARELKCFDLFSRSQRLARIFARYGFSSFAYDIQSQASQDIVSQSGFYEALNAGLMPLV